MTPFSVKRFQTPFLDPQGAWEERLPIPVFDASRLARSAKRGIPTSASMAAGELVLGFGTTHTATIVSTLARTAVAALDGDAQLTPDNGQLTLTTTVGVQCSVTA
jgi:hypothetical protein